MEDNNWKRDPVSFCFNDVEMKQIDDHIKERTPQLNNAEYNLNTDAVKVPDQNYALITIAHNQNGTKCGLKIRGAFETIEHARRHAQTVSLSDPSFDVYVVSMYEWLLIPPDKERIGDQVYTDETLNCIMSEYRTNMEKAKIEFDIRKEVLMKNEHGSLNKPDNIIVEEEETERSNDGVEESKSTM